MGSVGRCEVQVREQAAPGRTEDALTAAFGHAKGPRGEEADEGLLLHLRAWFQEMNPGESLRQE